LTVRLQIPARCSASVDAGVRSEHIPLERFGLDDFVAMQDTVHHKIKNTVNNTRNSLANVNRSLRHNSCCAMIMFCLQRMLFFDMFNST